MRKRWLVADGSVTLGLGLAYPAVSASASGTPVSPSAGTASNPLRIDIITKATAINNLVDIGSTGPSTGDLYVFSEDVSFARDPPTKSRAGGRAIHADRPLLGTIRAAQSSLRCGKVISLPREPPQTSRDD